MCFDAKSYPLSQSELGIFTECRKPTTAYNLPYLLPLDGYDPVRMTEAVQKLFELHPYLHTQFFTDAEGDVKKHIVPMPVEIGTITVSSREALRTEPFEMLDAPLYRFRLVTIENARFLWMEFHHAIVDGGSVHLMLDQLLRLYDGETLCAESFDANLFAEEETSQRETEAYNEGKSYYVIQTKDWNMERPLVGL